MNILRGATLEQVLDGIANLSPRWGLQEPSGSVALATNDVVALGRNVASNVFADYTVSAGGWTDGGSEIASCDGTQAGDTDLFVTIPTPMSTFRIEFTISGYGGGNLTPIVSGTGGTTRSSNNTFVEDLAFTVGDKLRFRADVNFIGDIDLKIVSLQQTNIAASSLFGTPGDNPIDGANTGAVVGVAAPGNLGYGYTFDGAVSFVNIYSAELNSIFNPNAGTLIAFARVSGAGVWADGQARKLITIRADNNNRIDIFKASANEQLDARYRAGGTQEQITHTGVPSVDYMMLTATWEKPGNFIYYFNGVVEGTPQAIAGTWARNLSSTDNVIGAASTVPIEVWDGDISRPMLATRALSAIEIADIWQKSGLA